MVGPTPLPRPRLSLPLALLLLASLAYLVLGVTVGRFPNLDNDEIFYKAPGREWAATGHFRSPELTGYLGSAPALEQAWLIYPPVYPFLYGVAIRAFGFGWRQSVGFDAVIHLVVAWIAVLTFGRLTGRTRSWTALLCFLSVLLLGVLGRPDDLATAFGLLGVLLLLRPVADTTRTLTWGTMIGSGICLGLCGATSPVAGVVIVCIGLPIVLARAGGLSRAMLLVATWGAVAATVFLLAILPVLIGSPHAYRQFLDQARLITTTDTRTMSQRLLYVMTVGRRLSIPTLGVLGLALLSLATAWRANRLSQWLQLWLGVFLAVAALLAMRIHNYSYLWFLLPFACAVCFAAIDRQLLLGTQALNRGALVVLLGLIGVGASQYFKETLALATLSPDQTLDYNAALVRRQVPPGSTIMTYALWWELADDYRVFEHQVSRWHWDDVQAVVSTSSSPIGLDHTPMTALDQYVAAHFQTVLDTRRKESVQLAGLPLSRSFRGYGVHILQRRTTPIRAGER